MKIIIHRGTSEIGGTCIELQSCSTRILLDFGMPLVNKQGGSFEFNKYKKLSTEELLKQGILPNVKGAYSSKPGIDGLIISHAHADHFGMMHYLNPVIPVWLGKATYKILELNNIFLNQNNNIPNPRYFKHEESFTIGDFKITPYLNDHSAYDSYSFLIEAEGKRLFYSGDFRSHGRREKLYKQFLDNPPGNIDCLIIEGTTIGRSDVKMKTEEDVEDELAALFKKSKSINYIYTSSQNVDRLVSIYKACRNSNKIFAADIYTINVLHELSEFAKFPTPLKGYPNIKVLYPHSLTTRLLDNQKTEHVYKFQPHKIDKKHISQNPSGYVLNVRPSMKKDLQKIETDGGNLIYSMWSGYKNQETTKEFLDWLISKNFAIHNIHTSGHANRETLKQLADALNPKSIIPVHTFEKKRYKEVFDQKVIEANDNEVVGV